MTNQNETFPVAIQRLMETISDGPHDTWDEQLESLEQIALDPLVTDVHLKELLYTNDDLVYHTNVTDYVLRMLWDKKPKKVSVVSHVISIYRIIIARELEKASLFEGEGSLCFGEYLPEFTRKLKTLSLEQVLEIVRALLKSKKATKKVLGYDSKLIRIFENEVLEIVRALLLLPRIKSNVKIKHLVRIWDNAAQSHCEDKCYDDLTKEFYYGIQVSHEDLLNSMIIIIALVS